MTILPYNTSFISRWSSQVISRWSSHVISRWSSHVVYCTTNTSNMAGWLKKHAYFLQLHVTGPFSNKLNLAFIWIEHAILQLNYTKQHDCTYTNSEVKWKLHRDYMSKRNRKLSLQHEMTTLFLKLENETYILYLSTQWARPGIRGICLIIQVVKLFKKVDKHYPKESMLLSHPWILIFLLHVNGINLSCILFICTT